MADNTNTIGYLKGTILRGIPPHLNNRYNVILRPPSTIFGSEPLRFHATEVQLPERGFKAIEEQLFGVKQTLPINKEYGEAMITFLLSEDCRERRYIERWMDKMTGEIWPSGGNPVTENSEIPDAMRPLSDYSGSITVEMLSRSGEVRATTIMNRCFPLKINAMSLASGNNEFSTFSVNFSMIDYNFI